MRRRLAIIIGCLVLSSGSAGLMAQTTGGGASSTVARNPVIAEVARFNPGMLDKLLADLERVSTGKRSGSARPVLNPGVLRTLQADLEHLMGSPSRGVPTTAESAQIAANPAFAVAYKRSPIAALALLRQANKAIREGRARGDSGIK